MTTPSGFMRLRQIIAPHGPIPVSRSTWYSGVASGAFPKPAKFGRISLWAIEDIDALIARLKQNGAAHSDSNSSPCSIGTAERT
jgi:predicted DNA-binding transcriptional regulator AlpA